LNEPASDTATDTSENVAKKAVGATAEIVELPLEKSAPGGIRTPNPQIRSLML
jgi:hypothetical protein